MSRIEISFKMTNTWSTLVSMNAAKINSNKLEKKGQIRVATMQTAIKNDKEKDGWNKYNS